MEKALPPSDVTFGVLPACAVLSGVSFLTCNALSALLTLGLFITSDISLQEPATRLVPALKH